MITHRYLVMCENKEACDSISTEIKNGAILK